MLAFKRLPAPKIKQVGWSDPFPGFWSDPFPATRFLRAHGIIGLFVGAVVFVLGYTLFVDWVAQNSDDAEAAREPAP